MPAAIGLIGVGMLGAPLAQCLVDAGHDVMVCDLVPARMASVRGAHGTTDPCELARAVDMVLSCVDGPRAATSLALGGDGRSDGGEGVVHAMGRNAVYLELTTMSLAGVRAESAACAARGVVFVECPVSGRPPHLTALLGGEVGDVARIRGVVAAFADHSFHLGPVGAGTVAKLVNQYLTYANLMVAAQGLEVGMLNGVAPDQLAAALMTCAGASRSLDLVASTMTSGTAGYGSIASILRDLELFAELSRASGWNSAALAELHELFDGAAQEDDTRPFPSVLVRYGLEGGAR